MNAGRWLAALRAAAVLTLPLSISSCEMRPRGLFMANRSPEIRLEPATVVSTSESAREYAMRWKASDPDGRVSHFVYAVDPRSVDRVDQAWLRTSESGVTVAFPRAIPSGRASPAGAEADGEPHVFAVRAVDDAGSMSKPATMAFFGENIAPTVRITDPLPNSFFTPITGTSVDIHWAGEDPDGGIKRYKYRLFREHNPDFPDIPNFLQFMLANPDSFRRLYAPDFENWESAGHQLSSARYTDLEPNHLYIFAITAFDNAGAYDPVFSIERNLLKFAVAYDQVPRVCATSKFFNFCAYTPELNLFPIEWPADQAIEISWFAQPSLQGAAIEAYRWGIGPKNASEEESLSSEPKHWTPWKLSNTSATIGPFTRDDLARVHELQIQARDVHGRVGSLRIRITPIRPVLARELLIVDDTRLTPDQRAADGTLAPPRGNWPTAAELDTFLYARGGYPWQGYPQGTLSPSGLLAGYDFDTLGTRGIVDGVVPLSTLSRYRHIIWMTDDIGSTYIDSPLSLLAPITSLRLMSSPGQFNTLASYVQQGGKLWLMGGGAAYTTLVAYNKRNTPPDDFTNQDGELIEGRFMYDFAHWRSSVGTRPAGQAVLNTPHWAPWTNAAIGRGWSGHGMKGDLLQPPYGKLQGDPEMQVLNLLRCPLDRPWPLRNCFFGPDFFTAEFIGRSPSVVGRADNYVREDMDPRPNHETIESTLDTLYMCAGGTAPFGAPVMTYYHGKEGGPVVFSGFAPWRFTTSQCAKLMNFVLQDVWNLPRQPLSVEPALRVAARESRTVLSSATAPRGSHSSKARR